MTEEELMKKLREDVTFNPWLSASTGWESSSLDQYVLNAEAVRKYDEALRDSKEKDKSKMALHLKLLPQPFVGTPEAGIWLMLKNPGWSEWDEYDYGGKSSNLYELREWNSAEEEQQMKELRRELIFKQYKFTLEGDERFYVLHDAFHTKKDGVGKCEGAYRWYTKQLFPANGNGLIRAIDPGIKPSLYASWSSRNLFVLDYFPYHSEKFYDGGADYLKQDYWSHLVEYGLTTKKLMVFWGSKILNRVKKDWPKEYEDAAKEGRIAILRSQKAVFCDWNFVFATDKCGTRIKVFVK